MPWSSRPWVSTRTCRFLPLISLPASKPCGSMRSPFFGAFHALAVDDAGGGARFARRFFPALDVERMMNAIERAVPAPQAEVIVHGASGGRSLGNARHWQPVLSTYITPLTTSRMLTRRLPPPRLAGGISGSICAHSSSVRSSDSAACRGCSGRFSAVHIGHLARAIGIPRNHIRFQRFKRPPRGRLAQPIRPTHKVSGRTLRVGSESLNLRSNV